MEYHSYEESALSVPNDIFNSASSACSSESRSRKRSFGDSNLDIEYVSDRAASVRAGFLGISDGPDSSSCEEICYGMICSVPIRFLKSKPCKDSPLWQDGIIFGERTLHVLKLHFEELRCEIKTPKGTTIAVLCKKTFGVLRSLSKPPSIRFQGIFAFKSPSDIISSPTGQENNGSEVSSIDVNIYGPRSISEHVAAILSQGGHFLQDPEWKPENLPYENPQFLELPDYAYEDQTSAAENSVRNKQMVTNINLDVEIKQLNFALILDKLVCEQNLEEAAVDTCIKTSLLPHQRKGLDFVIRKEGLLTVPSSNLSLWEATENNGDEACFKHAITGVRSDKPREALGGLLADEMGLGKSLIMLAAISGSLKYAVMHCQRLISQIGIDQNIAIPSKSTLVVVPSALLIDNWMDEINDHVLTGKVSYYKYHGYTRRIAWPKLLENDIVFTTYGTLTTEFYRKSGILHKVLWFRVVLDEAHVIRNPSTKQFHALNSVKSHIRWCLSGTPIQNRLEDLGSLVAFLKIPILYESVQFRRHIIKPITSKGGETDEKFKNLRLLLNSICLHRTRRILNLPVETIITQTLNFSSREARGYNGLKDKLHTTLDEAVRGYAVNDTILQAILRMRIFCNNGFIFDERDDCYMEKHEVSENILQQDGGASCHSCGNDILHLGNLDDPVCGYLTLCERPLCADCVKEYIWESESVAHCVLCRADHKIRRQMYQNKGSEQMNFRDEYPTKMVAVCDNIRKHQGSGKSIVFSFWRKSLDVLSGVLEKENIPFLRIDGSSPYHARKNILASFKRSDGIDVLLMTFGIGAIGLNNLSIANRMHILEPQWNPSVESQAIGRILRLGQRHHVQIIRYIMSDSIESSVQELQLQKLFVAKGGFGGTSESRLRERFDKLKSLTGSCEKIEVFRT